MDRWKNVELLWNKLDSAIQQQENGKIVPFHFPYFHENSNN